MAAKDEPIVIKKYANRRLYNTGTSTYVTLDDLAVMVKKGEDFTVQDAKTGEDITHPVLTQIIFEQENKDRQHAAADFVPAPADLLLRRPDADGRAELSRAVDAGLHRAAGADARADQQGLRRHAARQMKMPRRSRLVEEQIRRNTEMFHQAMQMFSPFPTGTPAATSDLAPKQPAAGKSDDLLELKEQIAAMQRKIDQLS